jgi:acetylornithine deacetylase/succinyl-diaminopimelate desuccinylase-like protein
VSLKILGEAAPGPASALRPDVLAGVTRATEALWPSVPVVPIMVMGATDGKALRIADIPTYGVQGIFFDRDDIRFHGRDERVGVQSFYEGQAFLYELVKILSKSSPVA